MSQTFPPAYNSISSDTFFFLCYLDAVDRRTRGLSDATFWNSVGSAILGNSFFLSMMTLRRRLYSDSFRDYFAFCRGRLAVFLRR